MKKTLTLLMTLILSVAAVSSAFAASGGNSLESKSFSVNSGSDGLFLAEIKLTQTKGVYEYSTAFKSSATDTGYAKYNVWYRKAGENETKHTTWTGKTLTLKVPKNTTYHITVAPYSRSYYIGQIPIGRVMKGWITPSEWTAQ